MIGCHWRAALSAVLALWLGVATAAGAHALRVELLLADGDAAGPPASAPVVAQAEALDDGVARLPLPPGEGHYWLRISGGDPVLPTVRPWLVLDGIGGLAPVLFHPPGAAPLQVDNALAGGEPLVRRGWALPLPHGWPGDDIAYLRVPGASSGPVLLRLATGPELALEQRRGARRVAAAFTVLVLGACVAFALWLLFRDLLYLCHGGYLAGVAVFAVLDSGDAGEIFGMGWIAAGGATAAWTFAALAVVSQFVFTLRFLELDRIAPRAALAVRGLAWLQVAMLAVLWLGRARVHEAYHLGQHVLLLFAAPAMLLLAMLARRRGVGHAGIYLLAWAPLLLLVAASSIDQLGLARLPWTQDLLAPIAVVESLLLAGALVHRALARHRLAIGDDASLARDPLTGALDGAALKHKLDAWHLRASFGRNRYGLLLFELAGHSAFVTAHGTAAGDALLQQALSRTRALLRADDSIARVEGARFAVISECRRPDCEHLLERIRAGLAEPFRVDGRDVVVDVCIGLAMSRRGENADGLFARAGTALHHDRERRELQALFIAAAQPPLVDA